MDDINQEDICVIRNNYWAGRSTASLNNRREYSITSKYCGICYIIRGTGEYIYNNKVFELKPGTLTIPCPESTRIRRLNNELYKDMYFILPPEYYFILRDMHLVSPDQPVINIGVQNHFISGFNNLINEFKQISDIELPLIIPKLMSFLIDALMHVNTEESEHQKAMKQAAIQLESEDISLEQLAKMYKMSLSNFRRVFKNVFNITPGNFRIKKKIEKIQQCLATKDIPLYELAQIYGYPDTFTLSKQFKKFTGYSPREYRKISHGIVPSPPK